MNLFSELKRRNVFRIAGIYAVVGWILMQVAGTLEESLNLPAWFDSVITAGLLIGFPIALLLAWAFEMTPEGVKPTEALEGDSNIASSSKKMDSVIIVGIVLILALGLWQQMTKPVFTQAKATETKTTDTKAVSSTKKNTPIKIAKEIEIVDASIAVLPFTDLSKNGDQEYFSDGISEEILNVLVQIDALKVASRTSSFGFKGQEALGLPSIARRLNVRHILEGSVRKSGDMIRITAQLIDAQTDQHLWSQTFDRTLTTENIFSIQDNIAKAIVENLGIVFDNKQGIESAILAKEDTKNLDAYELYLEGSDLFQKRNFNNLPLAIEKLEQAVKIDPYFARAWAKLSASYSVAPGWLLEDLGFFKLAKSTATKAIELNPKLALPHAVLGSISSSFSKKFEFFAKAIELEPKNTTNYLWRGETYTLAGFFDLAEADLNRCLTLDPEYLMCQKGLAIALIFSGKPDQGIQLFEKFISAGGKGSRVIPILAYAQSRNHRALRWALASLHNAVLLNGRSERMYRALTDPNFDFEKETANFKIEYRAVNGNSEFKSILEVFLLKQYQYLKPLDYQLFWWVRNDEEFLKSPHRKRLMRELGLDDYWYENGFPPQCRPIKNSKIAHDFECD